MSLKGQVALVTGASRDPGLGRTIALGMAARGADIVICGGTNGEALERNAASIRAAGARVVAALLDLTNADSVGTAISGAVRSLGRVDILVNCASARGDHGLLEMPIEEWHRVLSVNLDGAFNCARAVLPYMVKQRYGRIINIASISGQAGDRNRAHVVTAKAGIIGFTKAIAAEFGEYGITANTVSPGLVDTPRQSGAGLTQRLKRIQESPLGRPGSAEEIANACAFLASREASFITGQTLNVNGGAYMG